MPDLQPGVWQETQGHVARIDDLLTTALKGLDPKPPDTSPAPVKKRYSEQLSAAVALAFAEELRERGLPGTRPALPGELDLSGAERRLAGGIGAKKVDVTWATEESGLILGLSIKTINWMDRKTKNYQKNLTNRRGDMLIEAVTLHRRFPYAVLGGFLFFDWGAAEDLTSTRRSTFDNAHQRLRLFTGRPDPAGREEQYERLYLLLVDANKFQPRLRVTEVGRPRDYRQLDDVFAELIVLVAERNFDFYEAVDGNLVKIRDTSRGRARADEAEDDDDDE